VEDNEDTYYEQDAFVTSPEMNAAMTEINDRLGFPQDQQLSFDDVELIYDACRQK